MFNSNTLWNRDGYVPEVWEKPYDEDRSTTRSDEIELFDRLWTRVSGGRKRTYAEGEAE